MTKQEIEQILINHIPLRKSLIEWYARLNEQCNEERERVGIKGISYDGDKVMASHSYDEKLVQMVDNINKLLRANEERLRETEKQLRQINEVEKAVNRLNKDDQKIILTLYFPRKTLEQAADILKLDKTTVWRQKESALESLTYKLKNI